MSLQLRSNLRQMKHYNYWTSALRVPSVPSLRKFCPTRFHSRRPTSLRVRNSAPSSSSPFQRRVKYYSIVRSEALLGLSLRRREATRKNLSFKNWTNAGITQGITGLWSEVLEGDKDEENEKKKGAK